MSQFKVQFQKGMSLQQFLQEFGSEEQCRQVVYQLRWPDGFRCPSCGHPSHCQLHTRALLECHRCQHRTSLTAGTGTCQPVSDTYCKRLFAMYLQCTIPIADLHEELRSFFESWRYIGSAAASEMFYITQRNPNWVAGVAAAHLLARFGSKVFHLERRAKIVSDLQNELDDVVGEIGFAGPLDDRALTLLENHEKSIAEYVRQVQSLKSVLLGRELQD